VIYKLIKNVNNSEHGKMQGKTNGIRDL
jgi:hypothetical protein